MVLGIEASNILAGGGIVHLKELLSHANPMDHGFHRTIIWASERTLQQLPDREWLIKKSHPWLNRSIVFRGLWLTLFFPKEARSAGIDILFSPGANHVNFDPVVSMCQNLLPFDRKESKLYGFSWMRFRIFILSYLQTKAFKRAKGIIVLTASNVHYIQEKVSIENKHAVIPHGINSMFYHASSFKKLNPTIKLLYVSTVDVYKHQWNVVQAVYSLLDKGYSVELTLVGSQYPSAWNKLKRSINIHPEYASHITYLSNVPYDELNKVYAAADIFVFASSCETFSLVLLESMTSNLPIACSDRDTLKDTLGDGGIYFDPYSAESIEKSIIELIDNNVLREELRAKAYTRAQSYSWSACADQTFRYLSKIAKG